VDVVVAGADGWVAHGLPARVESACVPNAGTSRRTLLGSHAWISSAPSVAPGWYASNPAAGIKGEFSL